MASEFHDLDLQDIRFLMETAAVPIGDSAIVQTMTSTSPSAVASRSSYFVPNNIISTQGQPEGDDEPTVVMSTSIDMERAFPLINTILPFEACLYHEILPLHRQDDELYLGMVNLEDTEALEYARRMLGFLKCHLIPQTITIETHRDVLSRYLNQQQQRLNTPALPQPSAPDPSTPAIEQPAAIESDEPEPDESELNESELNESELDTVAIDLEAATGGSAALPGSALPELVLQAPPSRQPWQSLNGDALVQGLLLRMMGSGVGRLFLVHKGQFGQVLWTENGAAKMVLEQVAIAQFDQAIAALKAMTHLADDPVTKPTEVEIERFYQRNRILLRLRIVPKNGGEEATIQVLRGAALKFYQKHQAQNLHRDTQAIVQQLRHKVMQLSQRNQSDGIDRSTLPDIDRTIANLEAQLSELKQLRDRLKGE
ncbi:MAG: hypothetical protein RLZZ511_2997 [Cyanobacteriota bacterium]|jgi:hypothetical protein